MSGDGGGDKAPVVVSTDSSGIFGHATCGSCGLTVDPWDAYCRHCGTALDNSEWFRGKR